MVRSDIPIEIIVPKKRQWADQGDVVLKVGLVKASVRRPARFNQEAIIALDERTFSYSSD